MKNSLILLLSFLLITPAFAQDKDKLERERQELQQQLKEIQAAYSKVKGQTKATLGQLSVIQKKVAIQGKYVNNINKEIRSINDDIYLSNLEVRRLKRQLDTLKAEYSRSVVYAYKNKSSYDFLNFIFSSNNFNDAMKRVAYLKSYRAYRQQQVANILQTQELIEERKRQLMAMQGQKKSALDNQQKQLSELEEQKKEKDAVVAKLKSKEKDLSKQIASKRKRDNQLKSQITAIIRREIEAAKKAEAARIAAEKKKAAAANPSTETATTTTTPKTTTTPAKTESKPKSYLDLNSKDVALNASFEKNRGSLPWPVDNGIVSIPFGTSKVGQISVDNPGITISTPSVNTAVKAVFDGEVSAVSNLGDGMMVMVRHGKYFTVYSNLSSANVSKGSIVRTGQVIGRTAQADDGSGGQLDLILMIESKNVNPAPWLRR